MTFLRNLPIKRRLTLIAMLASGAALLLASIGFLRYEQVASRAALVEVLWTTAAMLGDNSEAALAFDDQASAEQTLHSLHTDGRVIEAAIYDKQGRLFASYHNHARSAEAGDELPAAAPAEGHRFRTDDLEIARGIVLSGEKVGTVYIRAELTEISRHLWRYAAVVVGLLAVASLVSLVLSARLLAPISGPISHLSAVVTDVASRKDYSVRAVKTAEDELGRLVDGFNAMLREVELRERELQAAREQLELRVLERTKELRREISERRHAEEALRASEEQLANAFENAAIGMALAAPEGRWLRVNRALCEMVGYSEAELLATSFQAITHPEDRDADREYVREMVSGERRFLQIEKRYLHKDGRVVWIALAASLARDAQGQPLHFIAQIQDITKRKQAEAELEQTQRQLLEASRLGGMAEVATNVLHNVGNVLNSVNVSASLVTESIKRSKAANLAKAAELLYSHEADLAAFITGERGRQLPTYLARLAQHLVSEQEATLKELELLRSNIDHIKEIVTMQQSYAKVSGVRETVRLSDLVEDSLRLNSGALKRHGVEVLREFAPEVPPVSVEKHKVIQILVNLVRNAKYACEESHRDDKRIVVRVAQVQDKLQLSVIDNGVGIAPENLTRIFSHGFTTRKEGHGFGLHSGALAAKELGGRLFAQSDGPGRGAAFTLELPLDGSGGGG